MTLQFLLLIALTLAAGAYLARRLLRTSCGSGCGSCGASGCPARRLEAVRAELEHKRR